MLLFHIHGRFKSTNVTLRLKQFIHFSKWFLSIERCICIYILYIYININFPLILWMIPTVSLWKTYYKDNMFGYIVLLLTSNEYLKDISCSITLPFGYKYRWLCSTVWNNGKLLPYKRLEYIDEILCKISRI